MSLPLSGCGFGRLHRGPLTRALEELARHDLGSLEPTTAPPHLFSPSFGLHELGRTLRSLGPRVVSVSPGYAALEAAGWSR